MRKDKAFKFLKLARFFANEFSKDPSTKVGASFVDPVDFTELTRGYNGMPRGVNESDPRRFERPLKYDYFEHAERNAIYNLARRLLKGSTAVTTQVPTLSCIRAVISVGASHVNFPRETYEAPGWLLMEALLKETSVTWSAVEEDEELSAADKHSEKLAKFHQLAQARARIFSKDPAGGAAIFIGEGYTELAQGYSGLPRGADDGASERYGEQSRGLWVESSVRNAIYNCVRPYLKGSVALVTATTCAECARAVAAVGSTEVVYIEPNEEFKARWSSSIDAALTVLRELGVKATAVSEEELTAS